MATVAFAYGVETIQTRSTNTAGAYEFIITFNCSFWDDVESQLYNSQLDVIVATTATAAQIRTALLAAMIVKAASYGLTLLQSNIMYQSFAKG